MKYCKFCGEKLSYEGAAFCGMCGGEQQSSHLTVSSQDATSGAHQYYAAVKALERVDAISAERQKLESTIAICTVVGVVLAVSVGSFFASNCDGIASSFVIFVIFGGASFFIPFGFVPIKNLVANSGFFFVATAMFFAILGAVVLAVCVFIGPFYAGYMLIRKKELKEEYEKAQIEAAQYA